MKKNKGFTLIELLVVIAIIGVLASVVLASLNSARNKGTDAAVKSGLANMRAQASLYYDTNGNYAAGTVNCSIVTGGTATGCTSLFADSTMLTAITNIAKTSGATAYGNTSGTEYAIFGALKAGGNWCVDSTGAAKASAATVTSDTAC
jgi:prepilin-type N-terminal cleavage/methylation domain-containing protein